MKTNQPIKIIIVTALCSVFFLAFYMVLKPASSSVGNEARSENEKRSEAWDAFQFLNTSRAFPLMDIPEDAYEKAYRFYKMHFSTRVSQSSSILSSNWQNIGPNNLGGRTLGIAIDPTDTSIIWLGAASGGLWKSTTGGIGANAWTYIPTGFPVRGVSCIALDPTNTNVIYIGTGETYSYGTTVNGLVERPTRGTVGIGILKSTDGGITWTQTLNWSYNQLRGVRDLKINPLNPNVVYAATTEGVYKTSNAGATWDNVLPEQMVMDLEMDQVDTNIVYAGVGNVTSLNKGLYKTSNSGSTWTILTNGLPPTTNQGRITITAYPQNNKILYAVVADLYSTVGVYYSSDEGVSWAARNDPFTEVVSYQGWYAKGLCVKSDDPTKSLYGGVNVFKSENAGNDLIQVSNVNWTTDYVHSDIHEIVSNPLDPEKIYVLCDNGLYRSEDFGVTYYECNDGYVTSQFYIGSASCQDSLYLLAGAQDNNSRLFTGTVYWDQVLVGDGSFNAIDPNDDNIQYGSYQYLNVLKSFDRGFTWSTIISSPASATAPNQAAFIAPFIVCPSNTNVIYAGDRLLRRSINQGASFNNPSGTIVDGDNKILSIAVSATNSDSLFFATAPTDLRPMNAFRSINAGVTMTSIAAGLPNRYPRDMGVNPKNSREVYIVFSGFGTGHIFKSSNAGAAWTDISATLPDVPFHTLLIDPNHPDTLYAGGDLGVFVSMDDGISWNAINDGLPDGVMIFDLVHSPVDDAIVAFTHGNGVYKISRGELPVTVTEPLHVQPFTQQVLANPVHDHIQLVIMSGKTGNATIEIYDMNGRVIQSLPVHTLNQGKNMLQLDLPGFKNGTYFIKTEFSGLNHVNKFLVIN